MPNHFVSPRFRGLHKARSPQPHATVESRSQSERMGSYHMTTDTFVSHENDDTRRAPGSVVGSGKLAPERS